MTQGEGEGRWGVTGDNCARGGDGRDALATVDDEPRRVAVETVPCRVAVEAEPRVSSRRRFRFAVALA
jgi:hypothetical protein